MENINVTISLSSTEVAILSNDIVSVEEWVSNAIKGKVDNCWSRLRSEWTEKLMNDPDFTDPIPSNKEDFMALVTSRPDYLTREQREAQQVSPKPV